MRLSRLPLLAGFWCVTLALTVGASAQTITNQPQSITVNNASSASFTVGASNATSYQWQFDGANLTNIGNISGATSSTLSLENVNSNQSGSYSVVINGTVTSSNAVLTIVPGTIIRFTFSGLLTNAPSNSVDVQLFDHDKPATVQNFLHYVTKGGYTNMFFDRCYPTFVLQGGDYGASNQTSTTPPVTGWMIDNQFTMDPSQNPPYPQLLENESGVSPLIHNDFGTIAMALSDNTNSANSAFFFNLNNNSGSLDPENFTVFGRIIDATNVLQYFNAVTNGGGAVSDGELLLPGALEPQPLPNDNDASLLPVDYTGTNEPGNANLVFCNFSFPSGAPLLDTNPPVIALTSPNILQTNANPVITGTAADDVGLADIISVMIPQAGEDGSLADGGVAITNTVGGTSNWAVALGTVISEFSELITNPVPPGVYELEVQSQDGAGNLSVAATELVTNTAIAVVGNGTVTFTNGAYTNLNAVGYPFRYNTNYDLTARAGSNSLFLNWTVPSASFQTISPEVTIPYSEGEVGVATFVTNSMPNGISITYPGPNAAISTNAFHISGTIASGAAAPVTITCQVYSATSYLPVGSAVTTNGTTTWSLPGNSLPLGSYIVQAFAEDQDGNTTVVTNNFKVEPADAVTLNVTGPGMAYGITNGQEVIIGSTFQVTAQPNPGGAFYSWNSNGVVNSLNPLLNCTMSPGLTLTAFFVTNNDTNLVSFRYPTANEIVGTNALNITGNFSTTASSQISVVTQVFAKSNSLSVTPPLEPTATTNWGTVTGLGVGDYTIVAVASDETGDSELISEDFSVALFGGLRVIIVGQGTVSPVTNGEILPLGTNFQVTATPAAGQVFYSWNNGIQTSTNATQNYTMTGALTLTATFVPSNTAKGISITYPAAHSVLKTNAFTLKGKIAASMKSAQITCQFFQTNGLAVGPQMTTSGTGTWSIPVTNLPGGDYFIEALATNAAGQSTVTSENFSILAFSAVQGTYTGLFICTNGPVAPTNSGFLTFTLGPTGYANGRLQFPAYPAIPIYFLPFYNDAFITGVMQFSLPNFHGASLQGTIFIDLTDGTDVAFGSISSSNWSSQVLCYRAVNNLSSNVAPAVGKYIVGLQPSGQTNGASTNGYLSISVARGGTLTVSGALPDDATFSGSARVATNGVVPVYVIPAGYRTQGMLLGWEVFTNTANCQGQFYWCKAAGVGNYYKTGVGLYSNALLTATGVNYLPPFNGGQYSIVFQGGTLSPPLTNDLEVNRGQFVVTSGADDNLKISLSTSGVITGSLTEPDDNKVLRLFGSFLNPTLGGSGFIPEANGVTGSFQLTYKQP